MNDRELLELAAKAAGLTEFSEWSERITDLDSPLCGNAALHRPGLGGECWAWNPLVDDGDVLRLAAKCCLRIEFWGPETGDFGGKVEHDGEVWLFGRGAADVHGAVVRAAAEIGRSIGQS